MALVELDHLNLTSQQIIPAQDQESWTEVEQDLEEYGDLIVVSKVNTRGIRGGADQVVLSQSHYGVRTFLDWKWNDNPRTMRNATLEGTLSGASIMTVHASADTEALEAAVQGIDDALKIRPDLKRPWLLGVTVLTYMDETSCKTVFGWGRKRKVKQFALMAADAGLDGIVTAAAETKLFKNDPRTSHLKAFTAAVKPEFDKDPTDQRMAVPPRVAKQEGADFYIVGRGIIRAHKFGLSARQAVEYIAEEIDAA